MVVYLFILHICMYFVSNLYPKKHVNFYDMCNAYLIYKMYMGFLICYRKVIDIKIWIYYFQAFIKKISIL